MRCYSIPLGQSGQINKLSADYLSAKEELKPFYSWPLSYDGIQEAIKAREEKHQPDRETLVNRLQEQYSRLKNGFLSQEGNEAVAANIVKLLAPNAFTITTGHQLSIFTGPFFFVYKILSAIKYCKQLKEKFPDKDFVPVYWMATEDHDFEEIKTFYLFGKEYSWERKAAGATGRMGTVGIDQIINDLNFLLEGRDNAAELLTMFKNAYEGQKSLSKATRSLVHELFKELGLVIMDADDVSLKKALIPILKEDIFKQSFHEQVNASIHQLEKEYKMVVTPRPINVFYLEQGQRNRIVMEADLYCVADRNLCWTREKIEQEIDAHPERFSPNVVLRPMYQETILPNLAYIGGNNEIAYWLELKAAFEHADVFFPQLIVRDSALWVGKKAYKDFQSLNLEPEDALNSNAQVLKDKFYEKNALEHPAETAISALLAQMLEVKESIQGLPPAFVAPVVKDMNIYAKEMKKWKSDVHNLQLEMEEKNIRKVEKLHQIIFPGGDLQERHDNFIPWYLQYGKELFNMLLDCFDPLAGELHILIEE